MKAISSAVLAACLAVGLGAAHAAEPPANPMQDGGSWSDLKGDIIGDAMPADGAAILDLDAPVRAPDAATVPIVLKQTDPSVSIGKATLIIDENPSPVAAEMTFGPGMAPLDMELRVRVNQYSNVRVIAETDRGPVMTGRYVKASGGCSAPASRSAEEALAGLGEMRLKTYAAAANGELPHSEARREAQIMIRHPNYSGLQRDQITQLFVPAEFIDTLEVRQGDDLLFSLTGGISISENPVFRFFYTDNGAPSIHVHATDTEGRVFDQELPKGPAI